MKGQPYLIYSSSSTGVKLCQWEVVCGFTGCQNAEVKQARHVDTVITNNRVYTLVVVKNNLVVYKNIFERSNKPYTCRIC